MAVSVRAKNGDWRSRVRFACRQRWASWAVTLRSWSGMRAQHPELSQAYVEARWASFRRAKRRTFVLGALAWIVSIPFLFVLDDSPIPGDVLWPARGEKIRPEDVEDYHTTDASLVLPWLEGEPALRQREATRSVGSRLRGRAALARGILELHGDELWWIPGRSARGIGARQMLIRMADLDEVRFARLGRKAAGVAMRLHSGDEAWVYIRGSSNRLVAALRQFDVSVNDLAQQVAGMPTDRGRVRPPGE